MRPIKTARLNWQSTILVLMRRLKNCEICFKNAIRENEPVIKELLESDPETRAPWDSEVLRELLKEAIENGRQKEVCALLDHGPGLSINTTFDDEGENGDKQQSVLYLAARYGHAVLVECLFLVQKAKLAIKDMNGWTALHISAKNGHYSTVQLLLAAGADIHATTYEKETALYSAAWWAMKTYCNCLCVTAEISLIKMWTDGTRYTLLLETNILQSYGCF